MKIDDMPSDLPDKEAMYFIKIYPSSSPNIIGIDIKIGYSNEILKMHNSEWPDKNGKVFNTLDSSIGFLQKMDILNPENFIEDGRCMHELQQAVWKISEILK